MESVNYLSDASGAGEGFMRDRPTGPSRQGPQAVARRLRRGGWFPKALIRQGRAPRPLVAYRTKPTVRPAFPGCRRRTAVPVAPLCSMS